MAMSVAGFRFETAIRWMSSGLRPAVRAAWVMASMAASMFSEMERKAIVPTVSQISHASTVEAIRAWFISNLDNTIAKSGVGLPCGPYLTGSGGQKR